LIQTLASATTIIGAVLLWPESTHQLKRGLVFFSVAIFYQWPLRAAAAVFFLNCLLHQLG